MKQSLPCLLAILVWLPVDAATAQPATTPVARRPPSDIQSTVSAPASPDQARGDHLLVQAINQLERRESVTARLRQHAAVRGQQLIGRGSYWQQGTGENLRVRLELELQAAGAESRLLQISNSRFLWIDRQLPNGRHVSRIDLRQLRADPVLAAPELDDIEPGQATWFRLRPELTMHSGGLPSLLTALHTNFSFLPPQAMRLAVVLPMSPRATNLPVFAVVGHWKPEKLTALLATKGKQQNTLDPQPSTLNSPPDRLPQEVLLLFGQADLFPYRVEYRRLETPRPMTAGAPPIPFQLSSRPLAVLELSDVVFDAPVAAGQFDYSPHDANWVDQTAAALEGLRRVRQAQVAARANAAGTILPAR